MEPGITKEEGKKSFFAKIWHDHVLGAVIATLIAAAIISLVGSLYRTTQDGVQPPPFPPPQPSSEEKIQPAPKPAPVSATNPRLQELKSMVNHVKTDSSKQNAALIIDSTPTRSGLSPKMKLHGLFKDSSMNIIGNLFKEEQFIRSGFFREIYEGNTDLLMESGALLGIDFLLLGKLSYSFRKSGMLDSDLISCETNFAYKIISNVGNVIGSDNLRQTGAGFTEDGALESALENLPVQRPKQLFDKSRG